MRSRAVIIFIDIDGTLNGEHRHPNGYCGMDPECVYRLNRIVRETGARLVLSSAWRYMVRPGTMGLKGFHCLLMTYGLDRKAKLVGCTPRDEAVIGRGPQISRWLHDWTARRRAPAYVVLDNGSDVPPLSPETMTLSESLSAYHADRWVKTASHLGLTDADADRAIAILRTQSESEAPVEP